MSTEAISTLAGASLSLLFSYVPGFADWFARLGESKGADGETVSDGGTRKRLVMLGLALLGTFEAGIENQPNKFKRLDKVAMGEKQYK